MTHAVPMLGEILAATRPDALTFVWASVAIIFGALGVVIARNPVHSALMLVMTLFGVAVIFIELQANFLAAVQVIVYAGAIVVLFLFVIMLLGVDQRENLETEPLVGQRPVAIALVALALGGVLALGIEAHWAVGAHAVAGARDQSGGDVAALGRSVFTTYLFPFEVTSALLVIAVVGAVVLSRRPRTPQIPGPLAARRPEPADGSGPAIPSGPEPVTASDPASGSTDGGVLSAQSSGGAGSDSAGPGSADPDSAGPGSAGPDSAGSDAEELMSDEEARA